MNQDKQPSRRTVQLLYVINRLSLKAYEAESRQALQFVILNDTVHLVRYDRGLLFNLEGNKPKLLGVSGQPVLDKRSIISQKWLALLEQIGDKTKPQILKRGDFGRRAGIWDELQGKSNTTILWVPINVDQKLALGLWLELWHYKPDEPPPQDEALELISNFLAPVYATAWKQLKPKIHQGALWDIPGKVWISLGLGIILALFLVRVPLRIVAPCEVVPNDPYVIAAPLEGIVERVVVEPGDQVKKDDPLFEYDKNIPLQELKIAEKQVEISEKELSRALNLGQEDPKARAEVGVLQLKLQKELENLNLAKYRASLLTVKAPIPGNVAMDNPDEWRGKPVQVGERVMMLTDPANTKVRIWIPENDNIWIDPEKPVNIVLNVRPASTYQAKILYINTISTISSANLPSFEADAAWVEPPENVKLGLKGTALLYGEKVTLFYFLLRKPWAALRGLIGI